jgi:energy-coupling factor transporter ATP-binding protein EcfA2
MLRGPLKVRCKLQRSLGPSPAIRGRAFITITMKITRISGTNFKGASFTHHPGDITIFHGPNGHGKSSVLEALRLGMLGYDPRIPRKNPDIFRAFSSGDRMKVEVEFDNGKANTVELVEKKGVVKGEIAINEEFPDYLLDLSQYWNKSKTDRAQFLMSLCVSPENAPTLKALEESLAKLEAAISDDSRRRKTLEQAIIAKVDTSDAIKEPPKDLAQQIEQAKRQILEAHAHLRNFESEKSARIEAERSMEAMKQAQAKATREAPEPVCEHCGKTVQFLKNVAATSYQDALAEAFTRLQCMRPLVDIHASIKEWQDYHGQVSAAVAQMERQQREWIQHCGSRSEEDRLQAELDQISPRIEKNRETLKTAQEQRRKLLSDSVAPLLDKANLLLAPTLGMSLCIEEGEIGFTAGRFIPFVSLSGAQEAMAAAGLQLALSAGTKCRVVVIDELGKLHESTKQKLIETIRKLLNEGVIDQAIFADVSNKGYGKLSKKHFVEVSRD